MSMPDAVILPQSLDDLNEDLARILLREPPSPRSTSRAPDLDTFLRRARPLAEELAQLARQLEWHANLPAAEQSPDVRRLREVADRLSSLLDLNPPG
jgi:hypothetical protein